jgi:hypothetical protein
MQSQDSSSAASFDAVWRKLTAPYTPEACERETVRSFNRRAPTCSHGHPTTYSHAVGACRCEFGSLVRLNGTVVRECSEARRGPLEDMAGS